MISGTHIVFYSQNAEADRAFFREVLGFKSVDAGHGDISLPMRGLGSGIGRTRPASPVVPSEIYALPWQSPASEFQARSAPLAGI